MQKAKPMYEDQVLAWHRNPHPNLESIAHPLTFMYRNLATTSASFFLLFIYLLSSLSIYMYNRNSVVILLEIFITQPPCELRNRRPLEATGSEKRHHGESNTPPRWRLNSSQTIAAHMIRNGGWSRKGYDGFGAKLKNGVTHKTI